MRIGRTFWIPVENTVVGARVGVGVPERGPARAHRRQLDPSRRQLLLQGAPQGLQVPANEEQIHLVREHN